MAQLPDYGKAGIVIVLLGRRDDIITTAITTIVVTVVAAINRVDAWHQPLLRLIDTMVGIGVGVACKWLSSLSTAGAVRQVARTYNQPRQGPIVTACYRLERRRRRSS